MKGEAAGEEGKERKYKYFLWVMLSWLFPSSFFYNFTRTRRLPPNRPQPTLPETHAFIHTFQRKSQKKCKLFPPLRFPTIWALGFYISHS
jgi:hypothetical protein